MHARLMEAGVAILQEQGCTEILKEESRLINGKPYRIDLIGVTFQGEIAVECDYRHDTSDEKMADLKSTFKDVYVITEKDLVAYLSGMVEDYQKLVGALESKVTDAEAKMASYRKEIETFKGSIKNLRETLSHVTKGKGQHHLSMAVENGLVVIEIACPFEETPIRAPFSTRKPEAIRAAPNEAGELVTLKVYSRTQNSVVQFQSLLSLAHDKRYSQNDVIEYALSCIPPLTIPLPERVEVVMPEQQS